MTSITLATTIEELSKAFYILPAARKACRDNKILTIEHLLTHYLKYNSFRDLPYCRGHLDAELIRVCAWLIRQKLGDFRPGSSTPATPTDPKESAKPEAPQRTEIPLPELSPLQESVVSQQIEHLINSGPSRVRTAVLKHFKGIPDRKSLLQVIPESVFLDMRNIGEKSIADLHSLIQAVSDFTIQAITAEDDRLKKDKLRLFIRPAFPDLTTDFEYFLPQFFDANGKIKLFQLLRFLILNGQLFKDSETKVFNILYSNDAPENYKEIAEEVQLSPERVRQLKNNLEDALHSTFLSPAWIPTPFATIA